MVARNYRKWKREEIKTDLSVLINISKQLALSDSELLPTAKKIAQIAGHIAALNNIDELLEVHNEKSINKG